MPDQAFLHFPDNFLWGVAASAYQIEGAVSEDGRGVSIWDTFCRTPGKIERGETGDVAADHYHRWEEDVRIMADLGVKMYRCSTAWPRIIPAGTGQVNPKGLDFYDRLVDALLKAGIEPMITLYHWDLPQALQDKGGWGNRETVNAFVEYARVVAGRLADRVTWWMPHNEPMVAALGGYFTGQHAPGLQDPFLAFRAGHHLLLSHGLAVEALRASTPRPLQIGIAFNLSPIYPASDSEEDRQAARRYDGVTNRMFLDPVLRGQYPEDMMKLLASLYGDAIQPGDLEHIAAPLDYVGINYYSRSVIRHDPDYPLIEASEIQPEGNEYSQMWEIYPPGIYDLLKRVWEEYHPASIVISENGICVPDGIDFDGRVRDERRTCYLRDHLAQIRRAIGDGVPIRGYLLWSLMDNFEWAYGYRMRFGLVYVDWETQKRTVKDSGRWYANVIKANGFDPRVL